MKRKIPIKAIMAICLGCTLASVAVAMTPSIANSAPTESLCEPAPGYVCAFNGSIMFNYRLGIVVDDDVE